MHTPVQHYSKPPFKHLEGKVKILGAKTGKESEMKDRVRSMSGFTGSGRAIACRETLSCHCVWLKVALLLKSGMGGCGCAEVQREHKEVRGSWGTGNNEEESIIHSLGLAFGL